MQRGYAEETLQLYDFLDRLRVSCNRAKIHQILITEGIDKSSFAFNSSCSRVLSCADQEMRYSYSNPCRI